jgi:hypothetical protein
MKRPRIVHATRPKPEKPPPAWRNRPPWVVTRAQPEEHRSTAGLPESRRLKVTCAAVVTLGLCAAAPPAKKPDEAAFVRAITDYREKYAAAPNDMAKGGLRRDRAVELCRTIGLQAAKGIVREWTGKIETLSSTGDGYGVLAIRLDDHVTVGTTNNQISETMSENKTLIKQNSAVFRAAAALSVGERVVFSGNFFPSKVDCLVETSVTQAGSMSDPEFLFNFSAIAPAK